MRKIISSIIVLYIISCAPTIIREGKKMKYPQAFKYDLHKVKDLIEKGRNYKEIIKKLEEIITIYEGKTDISPALYNIGYCYMKLKGFEIAERYFKRLITEYPDSKFRWKASLFLYRIYKERKDTVKATYYLRDAIENGMSARSLPYFYFRLGEMEMEIGENLKAFNDFIYSFLTAENETLKDLARSTALRIFKFHISDNEKENLDYTAMPSFIRTEWLREKIKKIGKLEKENIEILIKLEEYPEEFNKLKEIAEAQHMLNPKKIGVLLPLSGKYAEAGKRILEGLELGLGIPQGDKSFILVIRDIGEKEENFTYFLNELLKKERPGIIIGPPSTLLTRKAAPYISASKTPFISFSPDSEVVNLSPYILRFFVNKRAQARALVEYAVENLGIKKFAILYPAEKFGFDYTNHFWDEILKLGGEIRGIESYKPGVSDFSIPIKKILGLFYLHARKEYIEWKKASKKEGEEGEKPNIPPVQDFSSLFIPDTVRTLVYIIPQLEYYDADITRLTFLGIYLWNVDEIKDIPPLVRADVFFAIPFTLRSKREAVVGFVQEYIDFYKHPPDIFSAFSYDLGNIIYDLFKDSKEMKGDKIAQKILSITNYKGVIPHISFLQNGDIVHENIIISGAEIR